MTIKTLTLSAALAAFTIGLLPLPGLAQSTAPAPTPEPGCSQDCDETDPTPGITGWPKFPGEEEDEDETGGPGPDGGPNGGKGGGTASVCGSQLTMLRRVSPAEIAALPANAAVEIMRICPGRRVGGIQQGLAELEPAIAGSRVLMGSLQRGQLGPQNVVGIAVGAGQAVIYVHR